MDLNPTPQARQFRDELRAWLEAHAPRDWEARQSGPDSREASMEARFASLRDWQRQVYEAGWAGLSWPKEYGGRGATLMEKAIFTEEMARVGAPPFPSILGLELVGPTIIAFGNEAQKQRYLAKILSGGEIWCQASPSPTPVRPRRPASIGDADFSPRYAVPIGPGATSAEAAKAEPRNNRWNSSRGVPCLVLLWPWRMTRSCSSVKRGRLFGSLCCCTLVRFPIAKCCKTYICYS